MPNDAYLHLILNHFPIIVNLCAMGVLIIGMIWGEDSVKRIAMLLFIVTALFTVASNTTGDGAASLVKNLQGVDRAAIKPHSQAADWAVWMMVAEGVAALAGWIAWRRPKIFPAWFLIFVLVLGLFGTATVSRTALLGGKIHHPEGEMQRP